MGVAQGAWPAEKGNATLIEWLDSPVVYRADPDFLNAMRDAARQTHQAERTFHHYVPWHAGITVNTCWAKRYA